MKNTPLGKFFKIQRINQDISQESMAEQAGVSKSYLSAVETGKKNASEKLLVAASKILNADLNRLKSLAIKSKQKLTINLSTLSDNKRQLAHELYLQLEHLTETEVDTLLRSLRAPQSCQQKKQM